jgi:hypothetical protein
MRKPRHSDPAGNKPKSARDWERLTENLAQLLSELPDDSLLMITAKRGWCYVQFAINTDAVHAEAMSNQYIEPPEYKLSDKDVQTLVKLGWQLPTKPPPERYDGGVMGGSPNYWQKFVAPVDYRHVAKLAIESLRRVYRIAHPNDLTYRAFEK